MEVEYAMNLMNVFHH